MLHRRPCLETVTIAVDDLRRITRYRYCVISEIVTSGTWLNPHPYSSRALMREGSNIFRIEDEVVR